MVSKIALRDQLQLSTIFTGYIDVMLWSTSLSCYTNHDWVVILIFEPHVSYAFKIVLCISTSLKLVLFDKLQLSKDFKLHLGLYTFYTFRFVLHLSNAYEIVSGTSIWCKIINKLVLLNPLRLRSDFELYWVLYTFCLVPHRSNAYKINKR